MKESTWKSRLNTLIAFIIILIAWDIVAGVIDNNIYIPKIEEVISAIVDIFKENDTLKNLYYTLNRSIISYIVAMMLAIVLGVLSKVYPFFNDLLKPINSIGKTVPTMILVLLSLIWFNKELVPYVIGVGIAFPILYEGIYGSLQHIDSEIIEMLKVYRVNNIDKIRKIYIPTIKVYITNILVSTFSLCFKVVIAGEVFGQPAYGIGTAVQVEKVNFNTAGIFAWIIIIAVVSLIFDYFGKLLKKKVFIWRDVEN